MLMFAGTPLRGEQIERNAERITGHRGARLVPRGPFQDGQEGLLGEVFGSSVRRSSSSEETIDRLTISREQLFECLARPAPDVEHESLVAGHSIEVMSAASETVPDVGQVANLRRVGNPPRAPVSNRRAGYHPAPHLSCDRRRRLPVARFLPQSDVRFQFLHHCPKALHRQRLRPVTDGFLRARVDFQDQAVRADRDAGA